MEWKVSWISWFLSSLWISSNLRRIEMLFVIIQRNISYILFKLGVVSRWRPLSFMHLVQLTWEPTSAPDGNIQWKERQDCTRNQPWFFWTKYFPFMALDVVTLWNIKERTIKRVMSIVVVKSTYFLWVRTFFALMIQIVIEFSIPHLFKYWY